MSDKPTSPEDFTPTGALPQLGPEQGTFSVVYPFPPYEIVLQISKDGQFLGIVEVKLSKDFLSDIGRLATTGYHDVEDLYR